MNSFDSDHKLRDDVRALGTLLGEVLQDQGGITLYERVERVRIAARERRARLNELTEQTLDESLEDLSPRQALLIIRAFSTLCALTNLAERVHRVNSHALSEGQDLSTFEHALRQLARVLPVDKIQRSLDRTLIQPVFTAHPTETTRRTILSKELRMCEQLLTRARYSRPTPSQERAFMREIQREIATTWQTEEHLSERPTVADEVEHALFYLSNGVLPSLSLMRDTFDEAVGKVYGYRALQLREPLVRFASWVGGDMDGNPNVSASTVEDTLKRHRSLALELWQREVQTLFQQLSQSISRIAVEPVVLERIEYYQTLIPEAASTVPRRYGQMPYRVLLWLMWTRLGPRAGRCPPDYHYRNPNEFLADLRLIADSLRLNRGERAGLDLVERLISQVEAMGFHLATLDVRQDSLVLRQACATLLQRPELLELDAQQRAALLNQALGEAPAQPSDDEQLIATLDVFRALYRAQKAHGAASAGLFIISMARDADDVLAPLLLARAANQLGPTQDVSLDISPLFETVDDLAAAGPVFERMLKDPLYREHLRQRGDEQTIMLGYSDSNKDSGLAAARWALQNAQRTLVAIAERHKIRLTLFHGRGGTISRGGSSPRSGVLGGPRGSVRGRLRVTEQGEIVHAKYGFPEQSAWTLEAMAAAVLEATALEHSDTPDTLASRHGEVVSLMAQASREHYRSLIEDPEFIPYFRSATPIDLIERMTLGSRPSRRRSQSFTLADLRAIPWVFAWTQSRQLIPGYYGVGAGLQAAKDAFGIERLRQIAREWPFFVSLLSDVEMVLAKVDLHIGARYAALASPESQHIFQAIQAEHARTRELLLEITQQSEILSSDPALLRAIRLREPYTDPIQLLQVDLLAKWRASERQDTQLEQALVASVIGVARGMQNTG